MLKVVVKEKFKVPTPANISRNILLYINSHLCWLLATTFQLQSKPLCIFLSPIPIDLIIIWPETSHVSTSFTIRHGCQSSRKEIEA